ncbi:MAG: MupG family TIM beta-alpha barrel fold protein [Fusobacteriales bacterium]|jgi:hypothetical protein|nr:MupG family TIM beta-alpha barrel fold protein [Fusobacteriales bacterium]
MKRKLGISIYPEKSTVEKDKEYIEKAHKYEFGRQQKKQSREGYRGGIVFTVIY